MPNDATLGLLLFVYVCMCVTASVNQFIQWEHTSQGNNHPAIILMGVGKSESNCCPCFANWLGQVALTITMGQGPVYCHTYRTLSLLPGDFPTWLLASYQHLSCI